METKNQRSPSQHHVINHESVFPNICPIDVFCHWVTFDQWSNTCTTTIKQWHWNARSSKRTSLREDDATAKDTDWKQWPLTWATWAVAIMPLASASTTAPRAEQKSRIVLPQQCWTSIETIGAGDIVKSLIRAIGPCHEKRILIQYLGLECIVDSTVFIFFFNCGNQLQLGHWCNFATNYRRIFFFFFTHRTLYFNIPQTSWFPRHNPNDQEAWLSRRKKRRDANKHATHHPIQHNPGC